MEQQAFYFVGIGILIHLTVFWMIVGKAVTDKRFRVDVIRLPVWVILSIGFFWPATLIFIAIFAAYLYFTHRSN